MPKATAEAEHERRATVHEPLPPGDQPISEDEVMAAMMEVFRRAGTPPHIVYAAQKTGRIVTVENQHLLSADELAEWPRCRRGVPTAATRTPQMEAVTTTCPIGQVT